MSKADIISAAIISYHLINSDNEFTRARGRQTARLWQPIAAEYKRQSDALKYGLDPHRPKFYGFHPLTGLPVTIVFNEPSPGQSRVMNWNPLTQCWFYSEDAGLTWTPFQSEQFNEYVTKVDAILDRSEYNGR